MIGDWLDIGWVNEIPVRGSRVIQVTDGVGNTATCSFTVTVNDSEPPSISCPANIVAAIDPGQCAAVVTYSPPVGSDNCPGAVTAQTGGLTNGAAFPVGVTTNTFVVTDAEVPTATAEAPVLLALAAAPTTTELSPVATAAYPIARA